MAPGDAMKTAMGETRAIAPGWEIAAYGESAQPRREYIADVIFNEMVEEAGELPPALAKVALSQSELQRYNPVARGDKVRRGRSRCTGAPARRTIIPVHRLSAKRGSQASSASSSARSAQAMC